MRIVVKSVVFAIIWGVFVLCATFLQLITENGFKDFMFREFYFANVGIAIIFMSIVFLADFLITYKFSPFKKLTERTLDAIVISTIVAFLVIATGYLGEFVNLFTILSSIFFFIVAKFAILKCYADESSETEIEVKLIG